MILLSVAHSASAKGAYNANFSVSEYEFSQIMTHACKVSLESNGIECDVLDVGFMKQYMSYKLNYIKRVNPELAIEIHLNSGSKTATYPMCIFYKNNDSAKRLSHMILNNLKIGFGNQGWTNVQPLDVPTERKGFDNKRYSFVLKSTVPAIIVEPLFISNDLQCKYLMSEGALSAVGMIIGEAIISWKKSISSKN